MWDGFDKRKFPRINLRCEIEIRSDEQKKPVKAVTENVGIGGVCVILGKQLERFSRCKVRLEFDKGTPSINCDGKIVWTIPTRGVKERKFYYDTGVEFLELDDDARDKVRSYIESHVEEEPKKK